MTQVTTLVILAAAIAKIRVLERTGGGRGQSAQRPSEGDLVVFGQ